MAAGPKKSPRYEFILSVVFTHHILLTLGEGGRLTSENGEIKLYPAR